MNQPRSARSSTEAVPSPSHHELGLTHVETVKLSGDVDVGRTPVDTGELFLHAANFVEALFSTDGIDPKMREVIALRSAKLLNCPYEWQANAAMAKDAGCTPAEIEVMASDGPVPGLDEGIMLILTAVDELTTAGTVTDATLAVMRATVMSLSAKFC